MFKVYYNSLCISCMYPSVFSFFFLTSTILKIKIVIYTNCLKQHAGMMSDRHFVAHLGIVVSTLQSFVQECSTTKFFFYEVLISSPFLVLMMFSIKIRVKQL